jgi:hypothetical protein
MKQKKFLIEQEKKKMKKYIDDSVDAVIDKYIIGYEENSLEIKNESFNYKNFILRSILNEADEELEDNPELDSIEDESNSDYALNINEFAKDVARLHDNYESLIDIQGIILKRVYNFLERNYSKDITKEFQKILKVNFELEVERTKNEMETDFTAPYAKRSGGGSQ